MTKWVKIELKNSIYIHKDGIHFWGAIDVISYAWWHQTQFLMEARERKFKFHRNLENTVKIVISKISFCQTWNFWSLFSDSHTNIFFGVISFIKLLHLYPSKIFWYKVFVHWKLKLLKFQMDSVLKMVFDMINGDNWKLLNHNRHLFHWRA